MYAVAENHRSKMLTSSNDKSRAKPPTDSMLRWSQTATGYLAPLDTTPFTNQAKGAKTRYRLPVDGECAGEVASAKRRAARLYHGMESGGAARLFCLGKRKSIAGIAGGENKPVKVPRK